MSRAVSSPQEFRGILVPGTARRRRPSGAYAEEPQYSQGPKGPQLYGKNQPHGTPVERGRSTLAGEALSSGTETGVRDGASKGKRSRNQSSATWAPMQPHPLHPAIGTDLGEAYPCIRWELRAVGVQGVPQTVVTAGFRPRKSQLPVFSA